MRKIITQNEFDIHDCGTPLGDGCQTCVDWFEQGEEKPLVKCKTRNCIHKGMVDPQYTENQIGSRCESCLEYIGK